MKRRNFLKNMAGGAAAVGLGGAASSFVTGANDFTASSYRRIIGANDTIRMAIIGSNGRGPGWPPSLRGSPSPRSSTFAT
ncbi:twin-arginine translocation signal domain-containing protein [Puia sp. P3]|uniref:twin-arginine translocation signal domain-containing protein n=1 Tax=Puia sp. P3 TaxID=3423952 RepID=UPI003D671D46